MTFDPNFNCGQGGSDCFMSSESFLDFPGLPDNEDSIDIANLIVNGNGSENGDENDLFKSLFPESELEYSNTSELKKEDISDYHLGGHRGIYDKDPELIDQYLQSGPSSLCPSACSSAANSPIPFNHPIFQTPPVTPPVEDQKSLLRQHLQIHVPQTVPPPTNMSDNPFDVMKVDEMIHRYGTQQSHGIMGLDLNSDMPQQQHAIQESNPNQVQQQRSTAANNESQKVSYIKQESQQHDMDMPLALTIDRTKQPLSSNLNMSNKRLSSSGSMSDGEPRNKKIKAVAKGTPEYIQKRERNNVAVRRSRDKAKRKALETQEKVQSLASENKMLREQVKNLNNEVKTLKSLLQNISPFPNLKT